MSKLLLISPPEQQILMEAGDRPNMGILYVANSARRANHDVMISDLNHDDYSTLHEKIKVLKPTHIGMTTTTPYYNWIKNFSTFLKSKYSNIKLIAGGPHATVDPKSLEDNFDFIVQGEGEKSIIDILSGKAKDKIVRNDYENDLDEFSSPARDLLPLDNRYGINQEGQRTTTLLSSRSCNYNCFFCTKDILGPRTRFQSPERTVEEVKELKEKYGFKSLYFLDDCFSIDRDRTMKLANRLIDANLGVTYRAVTRTDKVDKELLTQLKQSGLRTITFGIEHMNDEVLKRAQKHNTAENNREAVRLAKQLGLYVRTSMVMNLPGATKETMNECLSFAMKENVDYADFYSLIAYPGTQLWNNPEKYGMKIRNKDYSFYQTCGETNVEMENMSHEDFQETVADIRQKWRGFKKTKTPWIKK